MTRRRVPDGSVWPLRGCDVVLSEEMSDGTDYGGVRVENPFRGL